MRTLWRYAGPGVISGMISLFLLGIGSIVAGFPRGVRIAVLVVVLALFGAVGLFVRARLKQRRNGR